MLKRILFATCFLVPSAVLAAPAAPPAAPSMSWGNFYATLYGGATIPGALGFSDGERYRTDIGRAFGAELGLETSIPGVSFDVDTLATHAHNDDVPVDFDTLSLMVAGKYSMPIADKLSVFGGLGVGVIHINDEYEGGSTFSSNAPGYELEIGSAYQLTKNVALTGEFRYQNAFSDWSDAPANPSETVSYHTGSLLFGVKFSQ